MSVIRGVLEIRCDGPNALAMCPDGAAWPGNGTAAEMRARMREDGWARLPDGVDLCPKCREVAS